MANNNLEWAGFTFDRERIGKILGEIERRKKAAKDYVGDTRKIKALTADGQFCLGFEGVEDLYGFTRNGREQLAATLDIPRLFFNRLAEDPKHQGELANLTNHLFKTEPQTRLVRTLDGKVRAVLSNRYHTLDNADLFFAAAAEFQKAGAEIWEARLSDDSFRIYAVQPGISAEVDDRPENTGTKWESGKDENGGDRHVAAVCFENSETGRGGLNGRPCTLRKVCMNFNVWDETLTTIHLGRKREEEGWISDDTQRLEDKVIWSKVRDVVKTAFDPKRFQEVIAKLRGAKQDQVPDPVKAVTAAVEFCGLPESSIDAIRAKFINDKDFSRYGLVQAVTFQTHGAQNDEAKDLYDDAGAKILATSVKAILGQ